MRINKSRLGEVVFNKLNSRRYIVTAIDALPFDDGIAVATIRPYKWSEEEIAEALEKKGLTIGDDGMKIAEEALELTISSSNERLYSHCFNTVKEAVYKAVTVEGDRLVVDDRIIETGEIIPVQVCGTLPKHILVTAKRNDVSFVYAYDVENDDFVEIARSDDYVQDRAVYEFKIKKDNKDRLFYVISDIRVEPIMDTDENGEEVQVAESRYVSYRLVTEDNRKFKIIDLDKIIYEEPEKVNSPKLITLDGYFAIGLESDLKVKTIVFTSDFSIVRTDDLPDIPIYIGKRGSYMIGRDYVRFDGETYKTDTKALTDAGCVLIFEANTIEDGFELLFTDDTMSNVKVMTVRETDDRGRIVKIA